MDRSLRLLQSVEPELTSADALVVLEHVEPALLGGRVLFLRIQYRS
jgi:hypothetical protein